MAAPTNNLIASVLPADSPDTFYSAGGSLQRDAPSYVTRQADHNLLEALRRGEFCYILTSRQMGKSSLMVRTAHRLREEGCHVAVLDLTAVGQNLTPEQWYDGLLMRVGTQLRLEDELEDFWQKNERMGPMQRWMAALTDLILPNLPGRIVFFVDEIDTVRSLPFSTDEFFAGIRECYNRRTQEPEMRRLCFCLMGVATPSDLIHDTRLTPFNIGTRIELSDFTEEEARPLAAGLGEDKQGEALLKRILHWTGGHPYLTQRLCKTTAEAKAKIGADVDRLCAELFFSIRAREQDDNLLFVRERLLRSGPDIASLLDLYREVRQGKRVADAEANPLIDLLRLSGITKVVNGYLRIRNRIYEYVFDHEWIRVNMPGAEIRRERRALRRGAKIALILSFLPLVLVSEIFYQQLFFNGIKVEPLVLEVAPGGQLPIEGKFLQGAKFYLSSKEDGDVEVEPKYMISRSEKLFLKVPDSLNHRAVRVKAKRAAGIFSFLGPLLPNSESKSIVKVGLEAASYQPPDQTGNPLPIQPKNPPPGQTENPPVKPDVTLKALDIFNGVIEARTETIPDRARVAIDLADLLIEKNARSAMAYALKGYMLVLSGDNANQDNANAMLNQALQMDPNNYLALTGLGSYYNRKKDYNNAANTLLKAIQSNPNFAFAHYNLSRVYLNVGKPDGAMSECLAAIQQNGNIASFWLQLAALYRAQGDDAKAQETGNKAIDIDSAK